MEDTIPFGSRFYFVMLGLLVFARGADILSTRIATPNLILEGNPLAKKLGWTWGVLVSLAISVVCALMPFAAIVISTSSVLVAARNLQSAWLMRTLGEENYRLWYSARFREARLSLYLWCLAGQTILVALVGAALICFTRRLIPMAIGVGIVAYAGAVAFYSLLSLWRMRRGLAYTAPKFFDAHADVE